MWHVAIDINTNTYEEISTIKGELLLVENQKKNKRIYAHF
jgi:hypothetical protein